MMINHACTYQNPITNLEKSPYKTNTTLALPTYNGLWRCLGSRNSGDAACYRKNSYECTDGSIQ